MNNMLKHLAVVAGFAAAGAAAAAEITLFEYDNYGGRRVQANASISNLAECQFQRPRVVGDDPRRPVADLQRRLFPRPLRHARPRQLPEPGSMGLNDAVSSVRDLWDQGGGGGGRRRRQFRGALRRLRPERRQLSRRQPRPQPRRHELQRPDALDDRQRGLVGVLRGRRFPRRLPGLRSRPLFQSRLSRRPHQLAAPGDRRRRWRRRRSRRRWMGRRDPRGPVRRPEPDGPDVRRRPLPAATSTARDSTTARRRCGSSAATGCSAATPASRANAAPSVRATTRRCRGASTTGFPRGAGFPTTIRTATIRTGADRGSARAGA